MTGKAFTYVFLGALVGFLGERLTTSPLFSGSQRYVAYAVGAGMILFGIAMLASKADLLTSRLMPKEDGLLSGIYRQFFAQPGPGSSFTLGLFMGFLPCPATVAALLVGMGFQSLPSVMAVMLGFGAGTSPALIGLGLGGSWLFPRLRHAGVYASAILVLLMGAVTLVRGSDLLEQVCPYCNAHAKTAQPGACCCSSCCSKEAAEATPEASPGSTGASVPHTEDDCCSSTEGRTSEANKLPCPSCGEGVAPQADLATTPADVP